MKISKKIPLTSLPELLDGSWEIESVSDIELSKATDNSLELSPGDTFVAIQGENSHGIKYYDQACAAGAACIITDKLPVLITDNSPALLLVKNALAAYHKLALTLKTFYSPEVAVGLTGSCGKTSTKEILKSIFAGYYGEEHLLYTQGNTNNQYGVPRNLCRMTEQHQAAVIELGTNSPGEIKVLAEILQPDISIITNIGNSHLELLVNKEGVAKEKAHIFSQTSEDGICIIPAESEYESIFKEHIGTRRIMRFGLAADADVRVSDFKQFEHSADFTLIIPELDFKEEVNWSLPGLHQAVNASAAVCAGLAANIPVEAIVKALKDCQLPGMRMKKVVKDGINWINDAYNANPESMLAGIKTFKEMIPKNSSSFIILGDMLELGTTSKEAHAEIYQQALEFFPAESIILVGSDFYSINADKETVKYLNSKEAVECKSLIPADSYVYLKASRGTKLEVIIE